jgi:hypothetical protein
LNGLKKQINKADLIDVLESNEWIFVMIARSNNELQKRNCSLEIGKANEIDYKNPKTKTPLNFQQTENKVYTESIIFQFGIQR